MEYIKLNAGDPKKWATPHKIREAAAHGQTIYYNGNRCRVAANYNGYITAVTENGTIIQAWAGAFTVLTAAEPER